MTRLRPASASAPAVFASPSAFVVIDISMSASRLTDPADDVDQAPSYQRLAAREPDLADAELPDGDPDQPDDLVVGELAGRSGSQSRPSAGMQ